ncbi:UDP-forming cellulose synthase catalytic subunit [Photobacterium sp. DNB23_23_1]|uniref:Cellulose synthase catalytic subunit [UDP-forming] n=1 Tax=Photobacterium pectinilyticum TaxID=2906793 RepID=A0ABT1N3K0_9GAMM|nr:UDP-forming cellulose synthase catalytic subunit [Photobacterium sp. ZSDE20]MCQ1059290.1 UDP-forming cellulose synthase catalytic subunit [Photobacterium sp. ZSDE20]MDD1824749.1 UDP-forming cellulose synthase catalytic subunit [Photobacterium sp. ZSDE20]
MRFFNAVSWMKCLAAGILILAIFSLATVQVSMETHLWLSASAFFIVLMGMTANNKPYLQLLMLLTGAFISIRYIWWRYDQTLPWESSLDMPFALALLVTEIYGITIYLLGIFVNAKHRDRAIIPINEDKPLPTVDVFIPTYNESLRVVGPTIAAATQLQYPGIVNIWVLDDGGTAQKLNNPDPEQANAARNRSNSLKKLCQQLSVNYLTRAENNHAKAGNINHALSHSNGDLILILDADHVPAKDFLKSTIGHFQQQPNLGFVQTPHFFVTPNPIERNLGIENKVPSENEMFYNGILKGLDFWNASFFCGSAAVIRRKALDDIGGISTRTITEDADTALDIHAKGWDSAYINKAMIAGLSPDTFGSYVTQRTRWAQGMLQILMLNNPLLKRGLTLPQKLCYLNSTLFWFFPIFRMIYLIAPLCYLLFDLQIFVGNANDFIAYAVPHLVISILITQHLFGNNRNTLFSEFYETILAIFLAIPVLSAIINPRKPSFAVTPKGETTNHTHFSPLMPVVIVITAIIGFAEGLGLYRFYHYSAEQGQLAVVLVFNTFNLMMCLVCLGALVERRQRRAEPRTSCSRQGFVTIGDSTAQTIIDDTSMNGAHLTIKSLNSNLQPADIVELTCFIEQPGTTKNGKKKLKPQRIALRVHRVNYLSNGQTANCEVLESSTTAWQALTALTFGDSEKWSQRRAFEQQQRRGVIHAIAHFFKLGFKSLTYTLSVSRHTSIADNPSEQNESKTQDVRQ